MDSAWLVLLSLTLGLAIGAGFVLLFIVAARRGASAVSVAHPTVPDGVAQIIEAMESPGIVLDPSNNVMTASTRAIELGMVASGVLVHPELVDLADRVRRSGEPTTKELVLSRGRFGSARSYVSARVAPLGARYLLVLAEDRTQSHRLEQVRQDFVANISHELKTPIGAIGLLAEAIDSAAHDPEQVRHFAAQLVQESARLTRITRDVIDLSRLQATDALAHPVVLFVDQIIAQAVDQNRVIARAQAVTLVVGGERKVTLHGDERLLVTAVHNLIFNAIQHSPEHSRVGIGVRTVGDAVEIAVTDQGEGIPEADQPRVFERFFRVDQARSRQDGGSGLGLSIVKHAVQNHGGDVRLWSEPGHGSTFTIRLPLGEEHEGEHRKAEPRKAEQRKAEPRKAQPHGKKLRNGKKAAQK
ncbi:MAG: ATP-binding protein [Microbacteriaceae bacterium]